LRIKSHNHRASELSGLFGFLLISAPQPAGRNTISDLSTEERHDGRIDRPFHQYPRRIAMALAIYKDLRDRGYDVFSTSSINSEISSKLFLATSKQSTFLVLLTPTALEDATILEIGCAAR